MVMGGKITVLKCVCLFLAHTETTSLLGDIFPLTGAWFHIIWVMFAFKLCTVSAVCVTWFWDGPKRYTKLYLLKEAEQIRKQSAACRAFCEHRKIQGLHLFVSVTGKSFSMCTEHRDLTWTLMLLLLSGKCNAYISFRAIWKWLNKICMNTFVSGVLCGKWNVDYQPLICAVKGSSVVIPCSFQYPPANKIKFVMWDHENYDMLGPFVYDSRSADTSSKYQYIGDKHHNCSLRVNQVEHKDAGTYRFRFESNSRAGKWTGQGGSILKIVGEFSVPSHEKNKTNDSWQSCLHWNLWKFETRAALCSSRCDCCGEKNEWRHGEGRRLCDSELLVVWRWRPLVCFRLAQERRTLQWRTLAFLQRHFLRKLWKLHVFPKGTRGIDFRSPTCQCWTWVLGTGSVLILLNTNKTNMSSQVNVNVPLSCLGKAFLKFAMWVLLQLINSSFISDGPKNTSVSVRPSTEVHAGSSITLSCSSHANPPEIYTWFRKYDELTVRVGNKSELHLKQVSPAADGEYLCSATNRHGGQNSSVVTLKVKGELVKCSYHQSSSVFVGFYSSRFIRYTCTIYCICSLLQSCSIPAPQC